MSQNCKSTLAEPIIFFAQKDVKVPQQSKLLQAGKDLFICEDFHLQPREKKKINCKVGAVVPEGHFGLIVPRSSMQKTWIQVHLGILDGYYIENIHVSLTNECFSTRYSLKKDSSLAQIIFIPYHLGASILAHPDQLQFNPEHGKFSSGSSGNAAIVEAIQVEPRFRELHPNAKCPTCGHDPNASPSDLCAEATDLTVGEQLQNLRIT